MSSSERICPVCEGGVVWDPYPDRPCPCWECDGTGMLKTQSVTQPEVEALADEALPSLLNQN